MRFFGKIALFFAIMPLANAQSVLAIGSAGSANFVGSVIDPAGAIIGKAHVWIHEDHGNAEFTTTTDKLGTFLIDLPDSCYDVMIGSPGFQPFSKRICVHRDKPLQVKIELKIDRENMTGDQF